MSTNPDHYSTARMTLMGLCPLLVPADSLIAGACMGLLVFISLILCSVLVSVLRRLIPQSAHILILLLLSATCVSVLDLLMQAFLHTLRADLGIYMPLIAMNGIVLFSLQSIALREGVKMSVRRVFPRASKIVIVLCFCGTVRELLATGSLLQDSTRYFNVDFGINISQSSGFSLLQQASGALLVLAFVIAAMSGRRSEH